MVLTCQPEDRHGIEARLRRFARPGNRCRCLQEGVEWPAKQRHLLPRHNCRCSIAQPLDISGRDLSAAKCRILFGQQICQSRTMPRAQLASLRHPACPRRRCRKERCQRPGTFHIIQKEPAAVRHDRARITLRFHCVSSKPLQMLPPAVYSIIAQSRPDRRTIRRRQIVGRKPRQRNIGLCH